MKNLYLIFVIGLLTSSVTKKTKYYDYCKSLESKRAVIFSWSNYDEFSNLKAPHCDSDSISLVLKDNYRFAVTQYKDLNRIEFYKTLLELANSDPLLPMVIYLIGRGDYAEIFQEGYLLCKDSKRIDDIKESYVSFSNLKTMIMNFSAKNVLMISDIDFDLKMNSSFHFDGTYQEFRFDKQDEESCNNELKELRDTCFHVDDHKERVWLSSGNLTYGTDATNIGELSLFGKALLQGFQNKNNLTVKDLFLDMKKNYHKVYIGYFGVKRKYNYRLK